MSRRKQRLFLDLRLRALGLLLLAVGVLIFRFLYAGGQATLGEMALIAIGFLGLSAGAALAVVGAGLLDPVEVSQRWTYRPIDRDDAISDAHSTSATISQPWPPSSDPVAPGDRAEVSRTWP